MPSASAGNGGRFQVDGRLSLRRLDSGRWKGSKAAFCRYKRCDVALQCIQRQDVAVARKFELADMFLFGSCSWPLQARSLSTQEHMSEAYFQSEVSVVQDFDVS